MIENTSKHEEFDPYDDLESEAAPIRSSRNKHKSIAVQQFNDKLIEQMDDSHLGIRFTYKAARFEGAWLTSTLAGFLEQKWISDVLAKVKVGKEANVYLCRPGEAVATPLVAVKIYRPRMLRNLKNDNLYREGRASLNEDGNIIRDLGMLKAQHKRSLYGEEIRLQSWIAYEFLSLKKLHAAGADVPQAYEMGASAVLMEYLGDMEGAAPMLSSVPLERTEAQELYDRMLENIDIMLSLGIVHGDLSAYNVLYWQGRGMLIDFPQVISPVSNRNAWQIFSRDMQRLCEYFRRQGVACDTGKTAADLWHAHGYHIHPRVHPGLLDANDAADRQYYQKNSEAE